MELKLVIVGGRHAGKEIPVAGPKFLIGRGDGCQFQPQNKLVSRKHCAILMEESSAAIEDCGSTNGTFLNDEKIEQRRELKDGDRIKIAIFEMQVRLTLSLEGKKKPKVHNVQEAAVRTVASSAEPTVDLDISSWLTDEDQKEKPAAPPEIPAAFHDTLPGKKIDETATIPASQGPPGKDKPKPPLTKAAGHALRTAKPMADNSRSAAEDVLKQFFPRKK